MSYSQMFKDKMIQEMTGPEALSATALSKQIDIPQATLSKWLRKAGIDSSYVYPNSPDGIMSMVPKTPNFQLPADEREKKIRCGTMNSSWVNSNTISVT